MAGEASFVKEYLLFTSLRLILVHRIVTYFETDSVEEIVIVAVVIDKHPVVARSFTIFLGIRVEDYVLHLVS